MSEKLSTKDFRRGNLFQYENCFYITETIRDKFIYGINKNGFAPGEFPIELIKPIPLTKEILLACGFEKSQDNEHFFINYHGFCLVHDGSDYCLKKSIVDDSVIRYLSFLHELQNIYALIVKKELEFKTELLNGK